MRRCLDRTWPGCFSRKVRATTSSFCVSFCAIEANSPSFAGSFSGFLQERDTECAQDEETTPGLTLDLPRYAQHCQWVALSDLDPDTMSFPGGAPLQLHTVPPGLLPRVPHFYVCTRCGKVFWEGSHFDRVVSMFEEILHVSAPPESAAEPADGAPRGSTGKSSQMCSVPSTGTSSKRGVHP